MREWRGEVYNLNCSTVGHVCVHIFVYLHLNIHVHVKRLGGWVRVYGLELGDNIVGIGKEGAEFAYVHASQRCR